ncbi:hypothetical protein DEJ48_03090 [Streptomyces venezuelae]|uniref:DUF2975 domain-containing protein n=1 Tax=Streptomyces venezuelae TaxID=54571 RepID=A0A5P2BTY7_STRVZ|nr:hypothetical protein DEJ48_03090 [Streptomyces venezuelae]
MGADPSAGSLFAVAFDEHQTYRYSITSFFDNRVVVMVDDRKLLEPLFSAMSLVLRVVLGLAVAGFILSLFVDGIHVAFIGGDVCLTADGISGGSSDTNAMFGAREGVDVAASPRYCTSDPTRSQHALEALHDLPSFILTFGGLLLLNRLLRGAARDGVYTAQTASRLRGLGWWLLVGSLLTEVAQAIARAQLLATLVKEDMADALGNAWDIPFLSLLTALGLFTFARIVRAGVVMREDVEATI